MFKQKIWEYLAQIVIVIFGVFLGLLLNEWNSDRKENNQQQLILNQIHSEIVGHQRQLENVIPYHDSLTMAVDSILRHADNETLLKSFLLNGAWNQIPGWAGIELFPLHRSAYESAKISNSMSNMDSELLGNISSYYETVALYNDYSSHITQQVFETNSETKLIDALLLVIFLRGDLIGQERLILKSSKQLQELL